MTNSSSYNTQIMVQCSKKYIWKKKNILKVYLEQLKMLWLIVS